MTAALDRARLQRLLGGEALAGLRQRLRRRYAVGAAPPDGFTLTSLAPAERDVLAGLLGRARGKGSSMRLSHGAIDGALCESGLAPDLRAALECLDGPIPDLAAQRERGRAGWAAVFARVPPGALADALREPGIQGIVKRLAHRDFKQAERIIDQAQAVLARLPAAGIARSRLAAEALGDAHALDPGRPAATLLRGALDPGRRFSRLRDLWAQQGVLVSELAKPVVVLNLVATGDGPVDRLLAAARQAGEPLHLSLRNLVRQPPRWRPGQRLYVCENPDVVAAAADELGAACPAMVSLDGQMSAAPRVLLDQLHAAGCRFCYHGDFDWPGVAIANGVIQRYGATPWRYSSRDYAPAAGAPLRGDLISAVWDAALAPAMRAAGAAVHEESQLQLLLGDLAPSGPLTGAEKP